MNPKAECAGLPQDLRRVGLSPFGLAVYLLRKLRLH